MKTILKRDPSIWALPHETHFFQDLAKVRRQLPDLSDKATRQSYILYLISLAHLGHKRVTHQNEWETLAESALTVSQFEQIVASTARYPDHESLFGPVIDCLTEFAGKERWIEKTPAHIYFMGKILHAQPDAKILEMVRDPRAALASRKLRRTDADWHDYKESVGQEEEVQESNYDPVLDSMMWKEAIHAARDFRRNQAQSIMTVRYEDLVGYPAATVRRVCEFVGLPYSEDLLNVGVVNSATMMKEQSHKSAVAKTGISTAAVEKWRKELSAPEIHICQTLSKSEMRDLGYEPVAVGAGARLKAPLLLVGTAANLLQRMGKGRRSPERARDSFSRIQRRLLKNLGFTRQ